MAVSGLTSPAVLPVWQPSLVSFASYLVDPDPQTPLLLHKNAASEEAKPVSENMREGIEERKASSHQIRREPPNTP